MGLLIARPETAASLHEQQQRGYPGGMWQEPYLETCCRSALHRLALAGQHGRPSMGKDAGCLQRLRERGWAAVRADGRFEITEDGRRGDYPGSARAAS